MIVLRGILSGGETCFELVIGMVQFGLVVAHPTDVTTTVFKDIHGSTRSHSRLACFDLAMG